MKRDARLRFADDPPPWEPAFEVLAGPPAQRRPLDPPPHCFSTPSPLRIRSHDFPPFRIPAVGADLARGFRMLYPRSVLDRHGITRADWARFLQDLAIAAREGGSARVPVAPLLSHGIFPSRTLGAVYDVRFARPAVDQVRALVEIWNQCALERRKIRVALQLGTDGQHCALVVESL